MPFASGFIFFYLSKIPFFFIFLQKINLGALCSVGPTPIHPELGREKAEGTEELLGSPFGISVLVPGLYH